MPHNAVAPGQHTGMDSSLDVVVETSGEFF